MSRYQNDASFKRIVETIFVVGIIVCGFGALYASNATSTKNTAGQKLAQVLPCQEDPQKKTMNDFVSNKL